MNGVEWPHNLMRCRSDSTRRETPFPPYVGVVLQVPLVRRLLELHQPLVLLLDGPQGAQDAAERAEGSRRGAATPLEMLLVHCIGLCETSDGGHATVGR